MIYGTILYVIRSTSISIYSSSNSNNDSDDSNDNNDSNSTNDSNDSNDSIDSIDSIDNNSNNDSSNSSNSNNDSNDTSVYMAQDLIIVWYNMYSFSLMLLGLLVVLLMISTSGCHTMAYSIPCHLSITWCWWW